MNKRHGMIAVALVALLLVTGCSTFFTGGVSGKVKYKTDPVANAVVAVYFDEGQCDADLANYMTEKVFHTKYTATTQANGQFAITNIPWDSAFPEYGKDADEQTIYVLFYHDDYGVEKYKAEASIVSGRSNELQLEFSEEIVKEETITLSFINAGNGRGSNGISSFRYSYLGRPGYAEDEAYEAVVAVPATGVVEIPVRYYIDKGQKLPVVTITDIKASKYNNANDPYSKTVKYDENASKFVEENTFTLDLADKPTKVDNIQVIPYIMDFNGFQGTIYTDKHAKDEVTVVLKKGEEEVDKVTANQGSSDNITSLYYTYSELGKDLEFVNTDLKADYRQDYVIEVKVGDEVKQSKPASISVTPKNNDNVKNFNITVTPEA